MHNMGNITEYRKEQMLLADMIRILLHKSNVRIDALYNIFPKKICSLLDVIGVLLLLYFMSIMTYHALIVFWDSTICFRDEDRKCAVAITTLGTPQWIHQLWKREVR